jgi:membrane peptidoglycan carboxypeptidase
VPEGLANTLAVGLSKDDQGGGTSSVAAKNVNWTRPAIGKTGTSQNNGSATFVGGTPQLAGAAMVFRPEGGTGGLCYRDVGNVSVTGCQNMFGGKTPAQTFFGAVSKILEGQEPLPLPGPDPQYMGGAAR